MGLLHSPCYISILNLLHHLEHKFSVDILTNIISSKMKEAA